MLFKAALHQKSLWLNTPLYLNDFMDLSTKPTLNAEITWIGCKYKQLSISIDIVPAIYKKGFWPSSTRPENLKLMTEDVKRAGCALLLQSPTFAPDEYLYNDKCLMRISCAPAEVAFFKILPQKFKTSYALGKILNSNNICPPVINHQNFAKRWNSGNYISSYMLKNSLLHVLADSQYFPFDNNLDENDEVDETFIKKLTLKIIQYLKCANEKGKLVPYFFQEIDIFSFEYTNIENFEDQRAAFQGKRMFFLDLLIEILEKRIQCKE